MLSSLIVAALGLVGKAFAASWIAPGAVWYDTDGKKIDAHGGGVVKRGDTFYWIGQAASSKLLKPWNQQEMVESDREFLYARSNSDALLVYRLIKLEEPWGTGFVNHWHVATQNRETKRVFLGMLIPLQ